MMPRSFLIPFCAAVSLAVASPAAQAADPSADSGIGDLTQNATIWSPELAGGQWGWSLTKYNIFNDSYKIGGNIYFLLSTNLFFKSIPPNVEAVFWNPLTGGGSHFSGDDISKIWTEHKDNRIDVNNTKIQLNNGRNITTYLYGNWFLRCGNIAFREYKIFDNKDNFVYGFYIVHKLDRPENIKLAVCREAEDPEIYPTKVYFATDFYFIGELSDGTLMFSDIKITIGDSARSNALHIIRLDQNFKPHTTLGGRVFVVDAAPINDKLNLSNPPENDLDIYNTFVNTFLAVSPAAKATKTP